MKEEGGTAEEINENGKGKEEGRPARQKKVGREEEILARWKEGKDNERRKGRG